MTFSGKVIGIDLGNDTCVISQAKRGGIETVMNEASARKTQTMVGFQGDERFIGAAAFPMSKSNFKNTFREFKPLLGRSFDEMKDYIASLPNKDSYSSFCIEEDKKSNGQNQIQISTFFRGEKRNFCVEQILAMLLNKLRKTVDAKSWPQDVVLSIPGYFSNKQRHSMIASCQIAGFNPLRLLNDHTAVALSFGIFKSARNLFDSEKQQRVLFVDIGYSNTSIALVGFLQGSLHVLKVESVGELGGRSLDDALFEKFRQEFKEKTQCDVQGNPKSVLKLKEACEKAKQTLTPDGCALAKLNCEFLMNEIDFRSELSLEDFESLAMPMLEKHLKPALERIMENEDALDFVEIIGGGTRPRVVKKMIAETLGLDTSKKNFGLSTTLNSDEAVSRGCALNSAMLSPTFRVKEFLVFDVCRQKIVLKWDANHDSNDKEKEKEMNEITLVEQNAPVPCVKRVTFRRREDFTIKAFEGDSEELIAEFVVKVPKSEEPVQIRCDFNVDINNLFVLSNAEAMHPLPDEVDVKVDVENDKKEKEKDEAKKEKENGDAEKKMETEAEKEEGKKSDEKAAKVDQEKKKKKRFKKEKLEVSSSFPNQMSAELLKTYIDLEQKFIAQDTEIEETNIAKNKLESYIYSNRDNISTSLSAYITPEEGESFKKELEKQESWLYDEGFDSDKKEYDSRLLALQKVGSRFDMRKTESEERPKVIEMLKQQVNEAKAKVLSAEMDFLSDQDRDKVVKKSEEVEEWLEQQVKGQQKLAQTVDPVLTSAMVQEQLDVFSRVSRPVLSKKAPPPPKKEEEAKDEEGDDKEMSEEANPDANATADDEVDNDQQETEPKDGMEVD